MAQTDWSLAISASRSALEEKQIEFPGESAYVNATWSAAARATSARRTRS